MANKPEKMLELTYNEGHVNENDKILFLTLDRDKWNVWHDLLLARLLSDRAFLYSWAKWNLKDKMSYEESWGRTFQLVHKLKGRQGHGVGVSGTKSLFGV